jgi:protein SCO1/2
MKKALIITLAGFSLAISGCAESANPANSHDHEIAADVKEVDENAPFKGAWLDVPYALPNAEFVDTEGNSVNWPEDGLPAPVTIVFFGYTHCDDGFCQTQTANAAAAVRGLAPELQKQVAIMVITSDPARDTGPVLREFLDLYDKNIIGLTGDLKMIQAAGLELGVQVDDPPSPAPAEGYAVGHGTQLIGFGPDGTAPVLWLPETPLADIRADIEVLLSGNY